MTLPSALWHLGKTIVNPTTEELVRSVKVGSGRRGGAGRGGRTGPCEDDEAAWTGP